MKFPILFLIFSILIATANGQADGPDVRSSVTRIVEKLRKENTVHFGYAVGYSARPETNNKYYRLYLKLKSKATNDELVSLTKDNAKSIVIYAFSILYSRNFKNLKEIFLEHLNDSTFYWTAGGCTGVLDRVNWFMFRRLNPANKNNGESYLTKKEYDFFCAELKKQDAFFSANDHL